MPNTSTRDTVGVLLIICTWVAETEKCEATRMLKSSLANKHGRLEEITFFS